MQGTAYVSAHGSGSFFFWLVLLSLNLLIRAFWGNCGNSAWAIGTIGGIEVRQRQSSVLDWSAQPHPRLYSGPLNAGNCISRRVSNKFCHLCRRASESRSAHSGHGWEYQGWWLWGDSMIMRVSDFGLSRDILGFSHIEYTFKKRYW